MQKLCCVRTIQQPLPVWIIVTSLPTHISINSHPFPVGIVSSLADVQPTSSMPISPSKSPIQASKHQIKSETPDFDKYRPYFSWVNSDTFRDTFKHTTQWGA